MNWDDGKIANIVLNLQFENDENTWIVHAPVRPGESILEQIDFAAKMMKDSLAMNAYYASRQRTCEHEWDAVPGRPDVDSSWCRKCWLIKTNAEIASGR